MNEAEQAVFIEFQKHLYHQKFHSKTGFRK